MQKRKRSDPNRPNWVQQLITMKADVETMPHGTMRELAEQRAIQLEAAIGLDGWLRPTNRTRTLNGQRPPNLDGDRFRFFVVGDKRVGWSIRAIGDSGQEEQLVGIYTSRDAAEDDLEHATEGLRRHG